MSCVYTFRCDNHNQNSLEGILGHCDQDLRVNHILRGPGTNLIGIWCQYPSPNSALLRGV